MDFLLPYLAKHGSQPQRSFARFIFGFFLFACGMGLIYFGASNQVLWQVPGLLCLGVGLLVALWGWFGLLANRLFHFISS